MSRFSLLLLTLFLAAAAVAKPVSNPRKDFLRTFASQDHEDVIWTEVELNGDGKPEVLVSLTTMYNGRMGNIWVLYESLPDGKYTRWDELEDGGVLEFHQKASATRKLRDGRHEIVCYMPNNGSTGLLGYYQLGAGGVTQRLSDEIVPLGADAGTFNAYFGDSEAVLKFAYENAGLLKDRYFPLRRLNEKLSTVQKGLLLLGVLVGLLIVLGVLRGIASAIRRQRSG